MFSRIRPLVSLMKRYRARYLWGVLALLCADAGTLYEPQLVKKAVNLIVEADRIQIHKAILVPVGLLLAVAFASLAFRLLWRWLILGASQRITFNLRDGLFAHFLRLSSRFYNRYKVGDLMTRGVHDPTQIYFALGIGVVLFVDGVLMTVAIFAILISNYKLLGLIVAAPILLLIPAVEGIGRTMFRYSSKARESFSLLSDKTQEAISGVRTIKEFAREEEEKKHFDLANRQCEQTNRRLIVTEGMFGGIIMFLSLFSVALLIFFGGRRVLEGQLAPGDFSAILVYVSLLPWPASALGFAMAVFQQGAASLKRIDALMDEVPEIVAQKEAMEQGISGDLVVQNLSYSYGDREETPALKEISFSVPEGTTLGILGTVGSGKSTLIKLLIRLLDSPEGAITYGGHPLHDFSLVHLRQSLGIVSQEPFLFSDTVSNNIAFGKPEASFREIQEVAKAAGVLTDIENLPYGWQTRIGERGISLSGGQKQRVALARVLLLDPPFVLLDDTFASVDTITEERVLRNFAARRQHKKTNIIISQRVSTLRHADHILVLEGGEIVQEGTHQKLLREEGSYLRIYRIQQSQEKSKHVP